MIDWNELIQLIVVALLGTGGATFIWTAFRSVIAWRDSAEGREDKAVARLEQFERNCREQLEWERTMSSWWSHRAGELEYALSKAGLPIPPEAPRPVRVVATDL